MYFAIEYKVLFTSLSLFLSFPPHACLSSCSSTSIRFASFSFHQLSRDNNHNRKKKRYELNLFEKFKRKKKRKIIHCKMTYTNKTRYDSIPVYDVYLLQV